MDEKIAVLCATDGEQMVIKVSDGCPVCGGEVTAL